MKTDARPFTPEDVARVFGIPLSMIQSPARRSWSILLTSANHGTVGPLGSIFPHAGEHHERVVVVEVPVGAGAPSDEVNLVLRAAPAAQAGQVAPADLQVRRATDELSLPELAEQFAAVEALGCDYTLSAKVCGKLFRAMTTPPDDAAGQVAVPKGFALVHEDATNEMIAAIEREVESQLDASGIARSDMCRLDGEHIFDALFDALPAVAQQAPADWISVDERLPEGRYCLATYRDRAGKLRIIRAMYVRQFEIEASGDECESETNEENDREYIKAGWYELIDNWGDYSSVYVCEGPMTHWRPLPPLPSAQASTAGERQEGGDRG